MTTKKDMHGSSDTLSQDDIDASHNNFSKN